MLSLAPVLGSWMRPRNLVIITLLALCHLQLSGQTLTNALPTSVSDSTHRRCRLQSDDAAAQLPDDPARKCFPSPNPSPLRPAESLSNWMPIARPELATSFTLDGHVVVHYRRLHPPRRQGRLSPVHLRTRGGRPSPDHRRSQRRAHQRHSRRHAPQHAHRALLQRQRFAGNPLGRPLRRLLHIHSVSVSPPGSCSRPATTTTASSTAP